MPEGLHRVLLGMLLGLGGLCVVAGAFIALYAGWIAVLLVRDPGSIAIIARLARLGSDQLQAARGSIGDHGFMFELGEPVYWLVVLVIGVLLLGIVASVAKALISGGLALLRPVLDEYRNVSRPALEVSGPETTEATPIARRG